MQDAKSTVLLVAVTLATLGLYGVAAGWGTLLFILTFFGVHAYGFMRKSWRGSPRMRRLPIAVCLGFSSLWLGMELNTVRYRDLSEDGRTSWEDRYDFVNEGLEDWTFLVAGFPLRLVEGHDDHHY